MPPAGFERTTPAGERPQTFALDRAATGAGINVSKEHIYVTQFTLIAVYYMVPLKIKKTADSTDLGNM
jgi:hypothetical protein